MSWLSAMRIIITALISVASASGIIIAIAKWLSEKVATHLSQKMLAQNQLKLDKILADYQSQLANKAHIQEVHFDTEFAIYHDLSGAFHEMISAVHWLFPSGLDRAPTTSKWKEICEDRYKTAQEKYNTAAAILGRKAPFIPKDKYDLFYNVLKLAAAQIHTYAISMPTEESCDPSIAKIRETGYTRTSTIDTEWDKLLSRLREYFCSLRNDADIKE